VNAYYVKGCPKSSLNLGISLLDFIVVSPHSAKDVREGLQRRDWSIQTVRGATRDEVEALPH
jgi:hypothetical protein